MPPDPRYIRVSAYCAKYGFVPRTVYGWVKQGRLPFITAGRSVRVQDTTVLAQRENHGKAQHTA